MVADHHVQPWIPTAVQSGRPQYGEANVMTRYLFCCTDMFSQYAWACPPASKHRTEPASAITAILDDVREPLLVIQIERELKYAQHLSSACSSPGPFTFSPAKIMCCSEHLQWCPTGCCILGLSYQPYCAPKTP